MPSDDARPRDDHHDASEWHHLEVDAVLEELGSSRDGLSDDEAATRLEEHGPNKLPEARRTTPLERFVRQFKDVLIYVLLAAAMLTAFLGEWIDTGVILAVVLVNAIIGYIQEGKAEEALESIRRMLALEATALRGGRRRSVDATELVPGDIVLLESGDRVPADLRIVSARSARVDESALTGESEPVEKGPEPVGKRTPLGDRISMAYSGTTLSAGRLVGVVVATGAATEIGRIGQMVSRVESLTTPLLRAIERFGKGLAVAVLLAGVVLFAFGLLVRGFALADMFLIVVGLAVAAVPEGLPAIMTITLALGVQRMARRNAVIRRLPAVETLGSVTVICSDKTGTLTKNEMTAREVILAEGRFEVTGTGYAPDGRFERAGEAIAVADEPDLGELLRAGLLCTDASLHRDAEGRWSVDGDPTEGAVIVLAEKSGLDVEAERAAHPRLDTIPFESEHRFMATLHDANGERVIYLKGAPEAILERCDFERAESGERVIDAAAWEARTVELAGEGRRVLAVATKSTDDQHITFEDVEDGLVLLGLIGMFDPPRPEAIEAVAKCRSAGIRVAMLTGDHARTAVAIGAQLGIGDGETVLTGSDLDDMDDETFARAARDNDVFARTSPEHKLRLVEALQAQGEVPAMTGDGVNDAPALKRADVGVAMGIRGSEAAKDASEMVLADDNFATIEHAVEEGRTIYDNLKKAILFIIPTNAAEALIISAAVVFGFALLPITPVQILWINMVTAVTLALALAFEPPEPGIMERPPRDPDEPILSGYLLWRIAFVAVVIAGFALWLFFGHLDDGGGNLDTARTLAVNVIVAGQLFYLFNARFLRRSSLSLQRLVSNRAALTASAVLVALQLAMTYLPPMQTAFGTAPLRPADWLTVIGAGVTVFLVVELEKAVMRRASGARQRRRARRER
jgi:magnesium-transporting ATPase (P-type)